MPKKEKKQKLNGKKETLALKEKKKFDTLKKEKKKIVKDENGRNFEMDRKKF